MFRKPGFNQGMIGSHHSEYCLLLMKEKINPHHFLFSPREKLTFCWSHKSGSTSVSQVFALITNSTFIIDNNLYYRSS